MQMPALSTAPGKLNRMSRRTLARMKANPKAKVLVPKFKAFHDALKSAQAAYNAADDARIDAAAVVEEADYNAREALVDAQLDLLTIVRRDYKDALYVTYLPEGLDAVKALSGVALRDRMTVLAGHLAKEPKGSKLAAHVMPIAAVIAAYKAPVIDLAAADNALALADTALGVAKTKWLAGYDALAGELRALFPRRKAFVDSFFPDARKPRKGGGADGSVA